jgi:hypothetical protein
MSFFNMLLTKQLNGNSSMDHTVTFTSNGEPYEIVSVKNGNFINEPVTKPISKTGAFIGWQINGNDVDFPYPPTDDVTISALFVWRSNTDYLYENFDVDKTTFPYVVVGCKDNGDGTAHCDIWFANKFSDINGRIIIPTGRSYKRVSDVKIDISSLNQDDVCTKIVDKKPSITQGTASSQPAYTDNDTTVHYTNDKTDAFSFTPQYLT